MIVIPMAGLSSRFFNAGYSEPKYELIADEIPLFDHAVLSFSQYFSSEPFLFIVRDIFDTPQWVTERCKVLGIKNARVITLNTPTRGQAETVYLGLKDLDLDQPITIFNIDTFRPHFSFPDVTQKSDGYLEVFKGEGDNWSYAKPESKHSDKVVETAEKNPISKLCSTGLYHFAKANDFMQAFEHEVKKPPSEWQMKELYIAPLYNKLIADGQDIRYHLIDNNDVIFCGTPNEYLEF